MLTQLTILPAHTPEYNLVHVYRRSAVYINIRTQILLTKPIYIYILDLPAATIHLGTMTSLDSATLLDTAYDYYWSVAARSKYVKYIDFNSNSILNIK